MIDTHDRYIFCIFIYMFTISTYIYIYIHKYIYTHKGLLAAKGSIKITQQNHECISLLPKYHLAGHRIFSPFALHRSNTSSRCSRKTQRFTAATMGQQSGTVPEKNEEIIKTDFTSKLQKKTLDLECDLRRM